VSVAVRRARAGDVPRIVELIRAGALDGGAREADPESPEYLDAFREIDARPDQVLVVAEDGGAVVGTLLFTAIRQIGNRGGRLAEVENVAVAPGRRGQGIGGALMRWAESEGRRRGCVRVQLTSNNARHDAHRFYARLGYVDSHAGMKLPLR
jgi:GNAT superfamily N-acetyltransferase